MNTTTQPSCLRRAGWFLLFAFLGQLLAAPAQDPPAALPQPDVPALAARAESGDAHAQFQLGLRHDRGDGVAQDFAQAAEWFRKAAEQNHAAAQNNLGNSYADGKGVPKDEAEAVRWYRKAAELNYAAAQYNLGFCYTFGQGVPKDEAEAVRWYRKAAEQNHARAQFALGFCYTFGQGVPKDEAEAVRWYRKAAEQNVAQAQLSLGVCYANGQGVPKDEVLAHVWFNLSGAQGLEMAREYRQQVERQMTGEQIAQATALAREWQPGTPLGRAAPAAPGPSYASSGTGFFISEDGYLVTCEHVIGGASRARVVTAGGSFDARVIKTDPANDLALLKVEGAFSALPVAASRGVRLGSTAATVGFPNPGLQGFSPKLARGEVAALAGSRDDARYFQISAPIQPGNSGGALVDERGNVIGVVAAKLSQRAALAATGALAENVNYAVKSSYLLSLLESVPAAAERLKEPLTAAAKFEDVVKRAEQATALVLVE